MGERHGRAASAPICCSSVPGRLGRRSQLSTTAAPASCRWGHSPVAADTHVSGAELCAPHQLSMAGVSSHGRRVPLPVTTATNLPSPTTHQALCVQSFSIIQSRDKGAHNHFGYNTWCSPCACVLQAAALHWRGARLRRGFKAWRSAVASKVAVQQHCHRSLLRRGLQGFISVAAASRRLRSVTWQRLAPCMRLLRRH